MSPLLVIILFAVLIVVLCTVAMPQPLRITVIVLCVVCGIVLLYWLLSGIVPMGTLRVH